MMSKISYILLLSLFVCGTTYAQDDTLRTEEVYIFREYEPTVSDAYKISTFPKIQDKALEAPEIKYSSLVKQVPTSFEVEPIKAARMKGDALNKLSKAYVKAGAGNYTNNLFEAYVNNSRSRKHNVGAYVKHLGSNGGIDDVGYNGFSEESAKVYGKKFLRQHLLEGDINYSREAFHYYGYPNSVYLDGDTHWDDLILDKDYSKQRYSKIGATGRLKSFYKDSAKTNYDIGLNYYNLTDKYGMMENYGILSGEFEHIFTKGSTELSHNEVIRVDASVDYNNYQWSDYSFMYNSVAGSFSNSLIKLNPKIVSAGKKWKLDLGMKLNVDADSSARFHFYPQAHFKYNVLKGLLIPYVGIDGGMQRNNFGSFSSSNPFVLSQLTLANTNKRYELYGGVRGAFSSKIGFNLKASRAEFRNMPLFLSHDTLGLTFAVVYDTVMVTNLGGEISYHNNEKLNLVFRGNYYIYDTKNELAAWHMPNLKLGMTGYYDLKEKIIVRADLYYQSGQTARSFNATDEYLGFGVYSKQLPGYIDANIGLEYRYTKRFSVFLNVNNLVAKKYYRWNNYPGQSINVLGGLTYSFWE